MENVTGCSAISKLASCDETQTGFGADQSFRKHYMSARTALEEGNYARASRAYKRLIPQAGAFAPRLRLELSHSLLRAGDYADAAAEARALAAAQEGTARRAALAVLGTAEHEMALAARAAGDPDATRRHLKAADAAIAEVLKHDPELDPLGALAGRQASIKVQLKSLG